MRTTRSHRQRRAAAAALLAGIAALAAVGLVGTCSSDKRRGGPAAASGAEGYDPLAFDEARSDEFERRARAGFAHVLYAKSPGGAFASARRTARWRAPVEHAAGEGGVDPDLLEAIVLLESAGRPEVIAGNDPAGAAGLTQILAGTALDLLGMRVDLERTRQLTEGIVDAEARGKRRPAELLRARRRRVDDRFDPPRALAGTVRYLVVARKRFGREDLAVAAYHMGIGNLEQALRTYADADPDDPIAAVVTERELSYARLYFDSTPLRHGRAYARLAALGDDSSTYLWRVLAAEEIMRLYRESPRELRRLVALHGASDSAERVVHPPGVTERFADVRAVKQAREDARLVDPPDAPGLVFEPVAGPYRALRGGALSAALYIGAATRAIAGQGRLAIVKATTPSGPGSRDELHATGYAFDVARRYRSHRQADAFEFALTRLQALDLIAWRRSKDTIHIVAAEDVTELLSRPKRLVDDAEQ